MQNNILVYTFRSVTFKDEPSRPVFVFGKLSEDLEIFLQVINDTKPKWILGIGNANLTHYESHAINRFHGKKVLKDGPETYELDIPEEGMRTSSPPTESFCNWTSYRIAHFIARNGLRGKLSFLHVNKQEKQVVIDEIVRKFEHAHEKD